MMIGLLGLLAVVVFTAVFVVVAVSQEIQDRRSDRVAIERVLRDIRRDRSPEPLVRAPEEYLLDDEQRYAQRSRVHPSSVQAPDHDAKRPGERASASNRGRQRAA